MSMCLLSNTAFAATDESGQTIVAYIGETGGPGEADEFRDLFAAMGGVVGSSINSIRSSVARFSAAEAWVVFIYPSYLLCSTVLR